MKIKFAKVRVTRPGASSPLERETVTKGGSMTGLDYLTESQKREAATHDAFVRDYNAETISEAFDDLSSRTAYDKRNPEHRWVMGRRAALVVRAKVPDHEILGRVDEQPLIPERGRAEIVAVVFTGRMEVDVAHRRHHRAARLEREEPAAADAHRGKVERLAEHAARQIAFAGGEGPLTPGQKGERPAHIWSIMPSIAPISSTLAKVLTLSPLARVKVTSTSLPALTVLAILNSMT